MQIPYKHLLEKVVADDPRYPIEAYQFVFSAVGIIAEERLNRIKDKRRKNISALQLLNGMKKILLNTYGCMAINVLDNWNVFATDDFGNIVYNLVAVKMLSVSPNDRPEDFHDRFSFQTAFVNPFKGNKRTKKMPVISC